MKPGKVRLSFDVSDESKKQIDNVQQKSKSTTLIELFRKAVNLYELVLDHHTAKGKIILKNEDGTEEILRLL